MNWNFTLILVGSFALVAAADASTNTHIETFEDGTNPSQWFLLEPSVPVFIQQSGGNPGAYLTHSVTNWPAPVVGTTKADSPFTGDYRARGVQSVGLDLIVELAQAQPHPDFSMTLVLEYNAGVPGQLTRVYSPSGISIPFPGDGWISYDFEVPSHLRLPPGDLPPGWFYAADQFGTIYDYHSWDELIENVTKIAFVGFDDPESIGFFLNWKIGADNLRLTHTAPPIPGDLNGDGVVDIEDLFILLAAWGECDDCKHCPEDLDGNCEVDIEDLFILLAYWG